MRKDNTNERNERHTTKPKKNSRIKYRFFGIGLQTKQEVLLHSKKRIKLHWYI